MCAKIQSDFEDDKVSLDKTIWIQELKIGWYQHGAERKENKQLMDGLHINISLNIFQVEFILTNI